MADDRAPTDVDVSIQPTLPTLELPDYHGRKPVGMKTSVNGAGTRITRGHSIDDRIVFVVEAEVKKAGHEQTDDGLVYSEVLKVMDLFEIGGEPGKRLLSAVRVSYRTADDQREGRTSIPELETAGVTDSSGVVLTEAELAELRGDPVRAMLSDSMTPVVVLYSDGARELWPDDFDANAPRPHVGERFETEDEGPVAYVYVEKLLHAETGETLAEWTREEEEARLLELEQRTEAEEKAVAATDKVRSEVLGDRVVDRPVPDELGTEPLLPGEQGYAEGLEPLADPDVRFEDDEDGFADVVNVDFPPEPSTEDFAFVDREISEVKTLLAEVTDLPEARRILEAEKRGRGRGLKTRKGAVDLILGRIAELEKEPASDA